jgi:hypothetical protein
MDRNELNRQVTSAIFRAERLPADSWEAQEAYRQVALLEELIAGQTSSTDIQGAIARQGAVTAAMRAGESLWAVSLATRYLEDDTLPPRVRAELAALRDEAERGLPGGVAEVKPVRFRFAA